MTFTSNDFQLILEKLSPKLIIGPLLRENLIKIKSIVNNFKIPVFSFTNDNSLSENGIWALGFSPFDQINKIIDHAINCKKEKLDLLALIMIMDERFIM